MRRLPSGFVTFMFTDIEGSTRLYHQLGDCFPQLIAEHDELVTAVIAHHDGVVVKSLGDGLFAAFADPANALRAAVAVQQAVLGHKWPELAGVRVRIGLHSGHAEPQGEDYVALAVHQAARVSAVVHGGQIVASAAVVAAAEGRIPVIDLLDLGEHRLKDFPTPVGLLQVGPGAFPPLRSISNDNLPRPVTALFGRTAELDHVVRLLRDKARLVTLSGPGGSGKTRLALEAGLRLIDTFRGGVFFVALAGLDQPMRVIDTIAATVGAGPDLRAYIGNREMLLILDNFEHVIDAASAVASLVGDCPRLRLLVTSRERLRVRAESEILVAPLPTADAVGLFCERAELAETSEIERLCVALDRLPLALELAAARARVLSVEQMFERLGRRLDALRGGRDAEARQLTLRATIGWSFELLTTDERELFVGLAIFVGGFTLEAAEAVLAADIDNVQSLVDKSLLQHGNGRFSMLTTIHEFAREQLNASEDLDDVRRRHASWYLELGRAARDRLRSSEQAHWLERLNDEVDNIRASLRWAIEAKSPDGFDLAEAIFIPWLMHGQLPELLEWYQRATVEIPPGDTHQRGHILRAYGRALMYCNRPDAARNQLDEALAAYEHAGDAGGVATALNDIGSVLSEEGDDQGSLELRRRALSIFREHADQAGISRSLHLMGENLRDLGDLDGAVAALQEAAALDARLRDRYGAMTSLHSLGDVALDAGNPDVAIDRYTEALEIADQLGDDRSAGYCLAGLASAAALAGEFERAATLWTTVQEAEATGGLQMLRSERTRYQRILTPVMGDITSLTALPQAAHPTIAAVVAEVLASSYRPGSARPTRTEPGTCRDARTTDR